MTSEQEIIQKLKKQAMLPLFYHADVHLCIEVVKALYHAGIRAIEFVNRGKLALENFEMLISLRNESMKDLLLGTGTIRTKEQAGVFLNAGADFLISPVFDAAVRDIAARHKVLWIPGCMTPTEIHVAANSGCKLVKLFPANVLGPNFVSAVKELFPAMDFMPTGGIDIHQNKIREWFDAGACAIGVGSKLVSKTILEQKDYTGITKAAKETLNLIAAIKA